MYVNLIYDFLFICVFMVVYFILLRLFVTKQEYFNAANILKNKMIHDFASLRQQDFNVSFKMRDNLIGKLKVIDHG
jgi:hypothetical protein